MSSKASLNHVYRTVWNQALGAMVAVAEIATGRSGSSGSRTVSSGGSNRDPHRGLGLSNLAFAVALAWGAVSGSVQANPTGGVAVAGQASLANNGNQLLVTTQNGAGTNYSAINWQSFSIPAGNTTHFQQPGATSTVINRVVTNTPSAIFGTLSSNGNVVLVNQSGIAVGAGALVDTAGFTASSLRMSDADALAGRLRFGDGSTSSGAVSVQGTVLARSGDVVLVGPKLDTGTQALIQAPNGNTILAAGQQVEITGRGLEGITLQVQAPTDEAVNLGTLKGEAVGIFAGTLRHSGLIQATRADMQGGKVILKASGDAFVEGAGKILANNGTSGGSVDVLGHRVAVTDQALIDTSGAQSGGSVRVGGDYQGKNPDVQNAEFVYFGPQASIKADATDNGKGGRVILWADDTTRAHGSISAQGGAQGGDGGFVETSGKQSLATSGARVNTRAPQGTTGLWLLDPNNIDIVASGPSVNITGNPNFVSAGAGTLDVADLTSALLSSNVSVTAIDNLTVSTAINDSGSNSLSLTAQNGSLSVNASVSLYSAPLALEATNGNISLGATIGSSFGTTKLKSGGSISQSGGIISTNILEIDAGGAVSLNNANSVSTLAAHVMGGAFSYKGASAITVGSSGSVNGVSTSGGNISLDSSAGITINQSVNAGSGSVSLTSAGGTIAQATNSVAALTANSLSVISADSATLNNDSNAVGTFSVSSAGTGSVVYSNAGSFAVGTSSFTNGAVTLNSNGGAITQSGAMSVGSSLAVNAGGGNVTLTNAGNSLGNLTINNGGTTNIQNSGAITISSVNAGSFKLKAGGNITHSSGSISTSAGGVDIASTAGMISSAEGISASGGAIKLSATAGLSLTSGVGLNSNAAGDAVILITTGGNLSGITPVVTSGVGGRWLAYVPSVPGSSFPTGMAFKQYNATYGTSVLGSGNGVLVAAAPSLILSSTTLTGNVSKVYDGSTGIGLSGANLPTISGGAIDGDILSGAAVSASSGGLDDRNVGSSKLVTVSGASATGITTSGGKPVYGYTVPNMTGNIGSVSQRPSSVWTGGAGSSWDNPANWDALPDGGNVASVTIPSGVGPIVFDASVVPTTLQSLTSGSPILVNGGSLQVSGSLASAGFAQTGGTVSGGSLKVSGPFNQTGGSIDMQLIDVVTPSGGIVFSNLKAPVVFLTASGGSISQLGGVNTASLTTSSTAGTILNDPGNRIGSFFASNSGGGNVELTNVGVLGALQISNSGGNVIVSNTGGITSKSVVASGAVSITANSPLDIVDSGISAGGNIVLTATNLTSSGNMTINAPVNSSGGSVSLNAANNLAQNSSIFGASGVTAVVGGAMTLGTGATSGATPVSYTVAGLPAVPPPAISSPGAQPTPPTNPTAPTTPTLPVVPIDPQSPLQPPATNPTDPIANAAVQTNLVTTFLDKFEVALQTQNDSKPGKDKTKNELVLEGEICRP